MSNWSDVRMPSAAVPGLSYATWGAFPARRSGGRAMRGIDRHRVIRVGLQQRQVAGRELVAVLGGVARVDDKERLFAGKRIGMVVAGFVARGWSGDAAVPRGDGAVGVAGLFRTKRGEILAQAIRV